MASNLSVKNVPESMLAALRARAARNHRSLQGELMSILEGALSVQRSSDSESATGDLPASLGSTTLSIDAFAARARELFPKGTPSSADELRAMRDGRHA